MALDLRLEVWQRIVRKIVSRLEGGIGKARAQPAGKLCNTRQQQGQSQHTV